MFKKPIVFVVGAGASCEYGLPLGSALKETIAKQIRFRFEHGSLSSGDRDFFQHVQRHCKNDREKTNEYCLAANESSNAIETFVSIDEALHFVAASTKAVEVGKAAIVSEILKAEARSSLGRSRENGRINLEAQDGGWLAQVLSMALAGTKKPDIAKAFERATFINFNYDRCIEHYLYEALQQKTGLSREQAGDIVNGLNMIRPYGSLGPLDWQDQGVFYGYTGHVDPFSLIDKIRTYTEQHALHDSEKIERSLIEAELIVFLGFGFHPQNLDILATTRSRKIATQVLATVKGMHDENLPTISVEIQLCLKIYPNDVSLQNMRTTDMLERSRPRILFKVG